MKRIKNHSNQSTINLVHYYANPAGIEVLIPPVVNALQTKEFCSFVIRPHSGNAFSVYDNMKIKLTFGSSNNLIAALRLILYARKRRKEIFHVFNIGPFFLLALRFAGIKRLVYSIHGTVYWHNRFEKQLFTLLWRMAIDQKNYKFTSNSKYSGELFREKISPITSCELLYNHIDLRRFHGQIHEQQIGEIQRIIYSGRLSKGKGLLLWIETAMKIHNEFPKVIFEIYGSGPLKVTLEQIIKNNNASEFILLKGHKKDIENAYRDADLMLFLSEYESFGNVVIESILCNTPVIVAGIPSMKEIFSDFPEFILASYPVKVDEIMLKLKDIGLLRKQTEIARKVFGAKFSLSGYIEKLSQLYESV